MIKRLFEIPFNFMKFGLGIFFILLIVYLGATVYQNWFARPERQPDLPATKYALKVVNTGLTFFTDSYELDGTIYKLERYYVKEGSAYRFYEYPINIDCRDYGEIKLLRP